MNLLLKLIAHYENPYTGKQKVLLTIPSIKIKSEYQVNLEDGHNGVDAVFLDKGAIIYFPNEFETHWNSINKTAIHVPQKTNYLIVEILSGSFPKIALEDRHGHKLIFEESQTQPYPDYVPGTIGKHRFLIPLDAKALNFPQLQLIFAPGKISAQSSLRIYFEEK